MAILIYLTVNQLIEKHPAFTTGGVRALIFAEHTNGLAKSGAIVRLGRKVLIDEAKFFAWIQSPDQSSLTNTPAPSRAKRYTDIIETAVKSLADDEHLEVQVSIINANGKITNLGKIRDIDRAAK